MLYDLLTEEDRTLLLSYINNVGNGNLFNGNLPTFLSSWNEEKEELHPLFGDSLILSKEITYNLPEAETTKRIGEILNTFYYSFFCPLTKEVCASNDVSIYYCVDNLFSTQNIMNKIYYNPKMLRPIDITTPQGNRIRISNGVKTMRVIGKLARAWGYEATYETFRSAVSRCFNTEPQTATLCLSIHPLDFFTMSDNNSDWDSCMSWTDDREYKQGTLEMAASPYCVVAYLLDPKEKLQWYDYTTRSTSYWNSKKWRQLIFVHPAFIVGNRHYPNDIPEVEEKAMRWLRQLAQDAGFSKYQEERRELTMDRLIDDQFYISLGMEQMYNDLNVNYYYLAEDLTPYFNRSYSRFPRISVNLSGTAHCVSCGNPIFNTYDPRYLTCNDCTDGFICSTCGEFMEGDATYINGMGQCFCVYCYEDTEKCEICDDFYEEGTVSYHLIENDCGETVSNVGICCYCLRDREYFPAFGELRGDAFQADNVSSKGHDILASSFKDFEEGNERKND